MIEPKGRRAFLAYVFLAFKHLHRRAGHDCRNCVFVDKLRVPIAAKENTEIVKRRDDTSQFHAIDQKYCQGNLLLANSIEKKILKILRTFSHRARRFFLPARLAGLL
jgi:hypothetical protein